MSIAVVLQQQQEQLQLRETRWQVNHFVAYEAAAATCLTLDAKAKKLMWEVKRETQGKKESEIEKKSERLRERATTSTASALHLTPNEILNGMYNAAYA